jgi:hypothetical protein
MKPIFSQAHPGCLIQDHANWGRPSDCIPNSNPHLVATPRALIDPNNRMALFAARGAPGGAARCESDPYSSGRSATGRRDSFEKI